MNTSVGIGKNQYENLHNRLSQLEGVMYRIAKKMGVSVGSEIWWEKEIQEGLEDIKHGRYTKLKTQKELQQFLDSLKYTNRSSVCEYS